MVAVGMGVASCALFSSSLEAMETLALTMQPWSELAAGYMSQPFNVARHIELGHRNRGSWRTKLALR